MATVRDSYTYICLIFLSLLKVMLQIPYLQELITPYGPHNLVSVYTLTRPTAHDLVFFGILLLQTWDLKLFSSASVSPRFCAINVTQISALCYGLETLQKIWELFKANECVCTWPRGFRLGDLIGPNPTGIQRF